MNITNMQFYYHSDHLGSASFLTDRDGIEPQQLVYLPFGELRSNREYLNVKNQNSHEQHWVDMKYNTGQYDTPYKFNGKEKDQETGYNNYGARYYYDWASIWLSVDPMSDKYPHVTNYIYCSNNPVMVVDPDGRDEWEVNAAGQIKHINDTPESKKHDAFYIVDENGNRVENKFLEFNKGTVTNYSRDESKNRDIFEIKGDENAKQVFELMAGNTNKEWTHAKVGTKKSGRNVLGTDHSKSSTGIAGYLLNTGWTLREVNHNHPSGRATPSWEQKEGGNIDESRGDVPSAKHYENKFPNIKLNVYTTEHKYSPYDSFGTKDERILTGKIR